MAAIIPGELKKSGFTFKLIKESWIDDKGKPQDYQVLNIQYNGRRFKWMAETNSNGVTEGQGYKLQMPLIIRKDPLKPTKEENDLENMYNILWEEANKFLFDNREELIGSRNKCKTKSMWDELEYVPKALFYPKVRDGEKVTGDVDPNKSPTAYVSLYMSKPKKNDEGGEVPSEVYTKICDAYVLNENFNEDEANYNISIKSLKNCTTTQTNVVWISDLYISADKIRWRQTLTEAYISEIKKVETGNKKDVQRLLKATGGKTYKKLIIPENVPDEVHTTVQVNRPDDSPPLSPDSTHRSAITINGDD